MVVALTIGSGRWSGWGRRTGAGGGRRSAPLPPSPPGSGAFHVWAALPLAITGISLVGAFFGYMWDVSLHIDHGRDVGPFANPSHYFILAGLYGIIAAGLSLDRHGSPGRDARALRDPVLLGTGDPCSAAS